jgi:hypothetical protein
MKISTYNSLLTDKKTQLIVSNDFQGDNRFRQAIITYSNGSFSYIITDGYNYLTIQKHGFTNLKSLINIVHGHITPKPWYAYME